MRKPPEYVAESWDRVLDGAALGAVAASRSLHHSVARWQTELVREALAAGASWEDIGDALGTTRQAAWARFRQAAADEQGGQQMAEQREVRQRAKEVVDSGKAHLRELEARWREEHERLRQEISANRHRLDEAKRRHANERQAARADLRRQLHALKLGRGAVV